MLTRLATLLLVLLLLAPAARSAAADDVEVDLELVLAVDVSGSMDAEEHNLQRAGYVAAIAHPEVVWAIEQGIIGRTAVVYVEWAGEGLHKVVLPWSIIDSGASARTLAENLAAQPITDFRRTSISSALEFSAGLFEGNGFAGLRRVIDVSGDGANNSGRPIMEVRDEVLAKGITINGLPIMLRPSGLGLHEQVALDEYYRDCVIGGSGAFIVPVRELGEMPEAVRRKLVLEIAGLPAKITPASFRPSRFRLTQASQTDCLIGERMRRLWDRE